MKSNFMGFVGNGKITNSNIGDVFALATNLKDIPRGINFSVVSESDAVYPLIYHRGAGNQRLCIFNEDVGHLVLVGDSVNIDMMFSLVERHISKETPLVETSRKEKPKKIEEQSQGSLGIPWAKGDNGERGERGFNGFDGERGAVGAKGEKGQAGERGEKGDIGEIGQRGDQGEAGVNGERGERGEQGFQGIQGEQGIQGIQGERGAAGVNGGRGERGQQGEEGAQGTQGVQGLQGTTGKKGARGALGSNGKDGVDGIDGKQGFRGSRGAKGDQGIAGPKGADGTNALADVQYPLVYDKTTKIVSLDSKNLLERLQKVFAPLANPAFDLSKFDWLAASGGGVGVKMNGKYVKSTIGDIDFRGSAVNVTQGGNGVVVTITGGTAAAEFPSVIDGGNF